MLGDFEILYSYGSAALLGIVVYLIMNCIGKRSIQRRFGTLKPARRTFYECGGRPTTQKPVRIPLQFLLICIFFILYDVELVFLFPYVSGVAAAGAYDPLLLLLFFSLFFFSIFFDYKRHALY